MDTPLLQPNGRIPTSELGTPTKYIRTFETDMKTVQAKGTPDLTPLGGEQKLSTPELEETTPAPPTSTAPPELPAPPPGIPELMKPSPLETYSSDFADRLKETGASTASVIAAEQDAGSRSSGTPPEAPRSNRLYIIAGSVLVVVGAIGAYAAYTHYVTTVSPVVIAPSISAPIFVDDRVEVSGTGDSLLQAIQQSAARPLAANSARLFYMSTTTLENPIFSLLDISAPNVLLRNMSAVGSMAGAVNVGGVQSPFFILSVTAYGSTFSGMLSWESSMPRTLAPLFPAYATPVVAAPPLATTTATTTAKTATKTKVATSTAAAIVPPIFIAGFRDAVVANHDVRVYRDEKGRSVMLYGYWNQKTLVIARDPAAFTEILQRLATSHS